MSDLKPRRCDEHDFQCYKCGVAAEVGVNIAVSTRAEPEPDWTIPLKRHVPEIKAEPTPKCDGCAYPLEVEEECRHITIWHCTGCAQITYTIATRAEPEHPGQLALELLRNIYDHTVPSHHGDGIVFWLMSDGYRNKAKALLEASKEKP